MRAPWPRLYIHKFIAYTCVFAAHVMLLFFTYIFILYIFPIHIPPVHTSRYMQLNLNLWQISRCKQSYTYALCIYICMHANTCIWPANVWKKVTISYVHGILQIYISTLHINVNAHKCKCPKEVMLPTYLNVRKTSCCILAYVNVRKTSCSILTYSFCLHTNTFVLLHMCMHVYKYIFSQNVMLRI